MTHRSPSPPRYLIGNTIGNTTVLRVLSWIRNTQGRGEYKYELQCNCGSIIIRRQDWLRKEKGRKMCMQCLLAARQGRWTGKASVSADAVRAKAKYTINPTYIKPNQEVIEALKIMSQSPGRFYDTC